MNRRDFFKTSTVLGLTSQELLANETVDNNFLSSFFSSLFKTNQENEINNKNKEIETVLNKQEKSVFEENKIVEENISIDDKKTEITEHISEDIEHEDNNEDLVKKDVYIEQQYVDAFLSVRDKLTLVQKYIGYGNFNIISFDEMLKIAMNDSKIGQFTKNELEFLELIFYRDPQVHGFYGEKITKNLTDEINKKEIIKIPNTGHFLFKGHSENTYYKMVDDIGDTLFLTSGIRSVVKQTKLFLDKLHSVDGNFTQASRSLAPPAYTYHSIGDFDVGKKGFGYDNFTPRFALTEEFFAMRKLKYIDMRYTINNKDGVRYEPWHVKII